METRSRAGVRILGSLLRLAVLAAALTGCGGDDGASGTPGVEGPPGPPGPGVTTSATALKVSIESVRIASPPVVEFRVLNENNVPFVRLPSARFTLAKLIPGSNGNPSAWQSYINRVEAAGGVGPGTEDAIQATLDSGGTLQDHGDGRYTYTFGTDITAVAAPLAVPYEPELTHRLALQISGGGLPATNAVYTWRPSDGATSGILQRDIVHTASCNECHGKLALHGGGRLETQFCVTCHNPGTSDANSGNTVDFKVMIHKIHRGKDLPSVQAGSEYAIYGFGNRRHDFSDVMFPQDIRNCSKCHDAADAATPQAGQWITQPSREACGACHDHVNFETGAGHTERNVAAANGECTVCHSAGGFVGSVADSHRRPARETGARFRFNLLEAGNTAPGQFPVVRFSVTDPGNSEAPYDIKAHPVWISSTSSLNILIGWDTHDYHNTGNGSSTTPSSAVSLNAKTLSTANGDGTFSVTSTFAIPANASGSAVIGLQGRAAADFDGDGRFSDQVPVKSAVRFAPITGSSATPRRQTVDIARCNQCHDQITLHGNARTDEPQLCVICHNANNTDIARRPADPSTSLDGKREEAIDFKTMIHGIHGAGMRERGLVVYGFGNTAHDFGDVRFPGILGDCRTCHTGSSFMPPPQGTVLATTVDSGASRSSPDDDLNVTAHAATCASCHDSSLARSHMEQNGASFGTPQSMVDNGSFTETCAVCHASGRVADVTVVHGLQ